MCAAEFLYMCNNLIRYGESYAVQFWKVSNVEQTHGVHGLSGDFCAITRVEYFISLFVLER